MRATLEEENRIAQTGEADGIDILRSLTRGECPGCGKIFVLYFVRETTPLCGECGTYPRLEQVA